MSPLSNLRILEILCFVFNFCAQFSSLLIWFVKLSADLWSFYRIGIFVWKLNPVSSGVRVPPCWNVDISPLFSHAFPSINLLLDTFLIRHLYSSDLVIVISSPSFLSVQSLPLRNVPFSNIKFSFSVFGQPTLLPGSNFFGNTRLFFRYSSVNATETVNFLAKRR